MGNDRPKRAGIAGRRGAARAGALALACAVHAACAAPGPLSESAAPARTPAPAAPPAATGAPAPAPAATGPSAPAAAPFGFADVEAKARALAARPYESGMGSAGPFFSSLGYDQYRDIRFKKEQALWRTPGLPFEVEFFHPGTLFQRTVKIHEVADGQVTPVPFSTEQFIYGPQVAPADAPPPEGFAGFRLHAGIDSAGYKDEFLVFLGASYFRAVGRGLQYGLSARALAVDTATHMPEVFPDFEEFWLVRPAPGAKSVTLYALLNSRSATGAYQFEATPGADTVLDVTAVLFFRNPVTRLGLAPLSSMFWFGENSHPKPNDWRPAVHDSDGLLVAHADGLWQWRPLEVSGELRQSEFPASALSGFGLVQRERDYNDYRDLEARYHQRPSAWIEPVGSWGPGAVQLVELPPVKEFNDNIVAFWTPAAPPPVGQPWRWRYRLHWLAEPPEPPNLAKVVSTRHGQALDNEEHFFIIEFARPESVAAAPAPEAEVSVGEGALLRDFKVMPNPETGGWRLALRMRFRSGVGRTLLRAQLFRHGAPISEQWNYLWLAQP